MLFYEDRQEGLGQDYFERVSATIELIALIRSGIRCTMANAYLVSFVVPRWIDFRTSLFTKSARTKRS